MSTTEVSEVLRLLELIPASGSYESARIATEVEALLRNARKTPANGSKHLGEPPPPTSGAISTSRY